MPVESIPPSELLTREVLGGREGGCAEERAAQPPQGGTRLDHSQGSGDGMASLRFAPSVTQDR